MPAVRGGRADRSDGPRLSLFVRARAQSGAHSGPAMFVARRQGRRPAGVDMAGARDQDWRESVRSVDVETTRGFRREPEAGAARPPRSSPQQDLESYCLRMAFGHPRAVVASAWAIERSSVRDGRGS